MFLVFLWALGNAKHSKRKEAGREGIGKKEEKEGKEEEGREEKKGMKTEEEIVFRLFFLESDHYNDNPSGNLRRAFTFYRMFCAHLQ